MDTVSVEARSTSPAPRGLELVEPGGPANGSVGGLCDPVLGVTATSAAGDGGGRPSDLQRSIGCRDAADMGATTAAIDLTMYSTAATAADAVCEIHLTVENVNDQ